MAETIESVFTPAKKSGSSRRPIVIPQWLRQCGERWLQIPNVESVLLFGSRATGQATPSSDWDVAVLHTGTESPRIPRVPKRHVEIASVTVDQYCREAHLVGTLSHELFRHAILIAGRDNYWIQKELGKSEEDLRRHLRGAFRYLGLSLTGLHDVWKSNGRPSDLETVTADYVSGESGYGAERVAKALCIHLGISYENSQDLKELANDVPVAWRNKVLSMDGNTREAHTAGYSGFSETCSAIWKLLFRAGCRGSCGQSMRWTRQRLRKLKVVASVVLMIILGLPISASSENAPMVHYNLYVQNGLPFEVKLRSFWADGSENEQRLNPCNWTLLKYPKRKHTSVFGGTKLHRRLLDSLHVTGANGYHRVISGSALEESMREGRSHALELSSSPDDGELNLKPNWIRCVRLLNGYDYETMIDVYYDDGSRKQFAIGARRIIFFGIPELGIFEYVGLSFWDRLRFRFRFHTTQVQRLVVRAGSLVLHDLDRRKVRRDFGQYYALPPDTSGTCMRLDGDGFSFVDSCGRLSEVCDGDGCRFVPRSRKPTTDDPVGEKID